MVSPYMNPEIDRSKNHFVSLPGIVAFFYYPGSIPFLCALFGQVIAFRYVSLGYVPGQSYLLLESLFLNGCLIVIDDRFLRRVYGRDAAELAFAPRLREHAGRRR